MIRYYQIYYTFAKVTKDAANCQDHNSHKSRIHVRLKKTDSFNLGDFAIGHNGIVKYAISTQNAGIGLEQYFLDYPAAGKHSIGI